MTVESSTNCRNGLSPSKFLEKELNALWQWRIETDPELAAALGMLARRRSKHALDPRSVESFDQRLQCVERALKRITDGITEEEAKSDLSKQEKLSFDLYVKQLTDYLDYTRKHKAYLCCVNRLEGPQTDLALYARYLPLNSLKDREFYRDFLKAIPIQLMEVIELLSLGMKEKRTPPQVSLSGVVDQIKGMVDGGLESFSKPIKDCFDLPAENDLKTECDNLLKGDVTQGFTNFASFLENDYIPNLRTEISAEKGYPSGEEYYRDCLQFHTTTFMSPQEVHDLGLQEVARVKSQMESIAEKDGYGGKLDEYLEHLRTAPEFEAESAGSLLAHYRNIVGKLYPSLLRLFNVESLPRQPLEITETPSASASMAPAAYYLAGSNDKSAPRPGMFYVNTSELPTRRTYECEALALHEAIPGHHIQGAIQAETPLPEFRRHQEDRRYFEAPSRFPFYTGYIEGWGLHSETLGEELGLYKRHTDKFGQLSMEAIRCCRLVVDTGMHSLGWSQEKATNYMLQNTAMGEHDARTEIARYITWPGQATAYKVGERFIRKMRTTAETELGSAFDPREFYDVVLLCGAVPLDVLEDMVQEYITKVKSKSAQTEKSDEPKAANVTAGFLEQMTFANWCKCCVVPGSCQV